MTGKRESAVYINGMAKPPDALSLGNTTLYRGPGVVFATIVAGAGCVGFAALALLSGKARVFAAIFALLLFVWLLRGRRTGVHVSSSGVKIVNYLASTNITWPDIAGFEISPYNRWQFVGHVVRRSDGQLVPILALSAARHPKWKAERDRKRIQTLIDDLNRLRDTQRNSPGAVV